MDVSESTKHGEIIDKFRDTIQSITKQSYSDEYLLRILKARNFNFRKSKEMFRFIYNVRQTYQICSLPKTYKKSEFVETCEFAAFLGFDKDGSPVQYISLGNADFEGFVRGMDTFDMCLYSTYCIEKLLQDQRENDKKTGRTGEGNISVIFDFENFSLQQLMMRTIIEVALDMMKMFQEGYPGIVNRVFLINVPVYFSVIFNIFKPILKMDLLERIVVFSKENTQSDLRKYIDENTLPVFLGGTRVDENGDPNCSAFLKFGCKLPVEEYGIYKKFLNVSDPGVSQITIPARSTLDLEFDVFEPNSEISIEMWSDNTFGLSLYYRNVSKPDTEFIDDTYNRRLRADEELISPYCRVHGHLVPVKSKIYCDRVGSYVFRFDNSFSWLSSKYVVYRILVLPSYSKPPPKEC